MSNNGIDMLTSARTKRAKSARNVPPPRHAPKEAPATPAPAQQQPDPAPKRTSQPAAVRTSQPAADQTPELRRVTVYLEVEAADWLDSVLVAGKQMKPRVNSASAVIRLAIARLAEQVEPTEAASILQQKAAEQQTQTGRKRV